MTFRHYFLATFDVEQWRQGVKAYSSFGYVATGYQQQMEILAQKLDLPCRPYLVKGIWCVTWDHVSGQGINDYIEVTSKIWELEQFNIFPQWSKDLIPGAPRESMENAFMNTYATQEEALASIKNGPVDIKSTWEPYLIESGSL